MKSPNAYASENWDDLEESYEEEKSLRVSNSDDSGNKND